MSITVKVIHDDDFNPHDFDTLGTMACWHRRYKLGHVQPSSSPDEWMEDNAPEGSIVLPLYLYDHSGVTMSTSPFGCPWDSGQVGVIVATPDDIRKAFEVKELNADIIQRATECLKAEVQTYDDYLTGNAWGFAVYDDGKVIDSCYGFNGSDALQGMKDYVDPKYHTMLDEAWNQRF